MTTPTDEFRNYSTEEVELYLEHLQHDSTMAYVPTFVYIFLLMLVGLIGNSLVIVIYTFKMTRTPLRVFIVAMAVFDLLTNAIIMPGKVYDLMHVWNFDMPNFCKVRMYLNASLVLSSVLLLVAVATIRYKMVCLPFKQRVTIKQANIACVIITLVAFSLCIPYGLIHGTQTRKTPNPNITARYCQVDDDYVSTTWPRLNSGFFIFIIFVCSSCVIYFYVCIGRATWKRRHFLAVSEKGSSKGRVDHDAPPNELEEEERSSECTSVQGLERILGSPHSPDNNAMAPISNGSLNYSESMQSVTANRNNHPDVQTGRENAESASSTVHSPDCDNDRTEDGNKDTPTDPTSSNNQYTQNFQTTLSRRQTSRQWRRVFERTSLMMLVITLVFFVGFLPFLGLNVFLSLAPEKVAALEGVSLAMYQLFLSSYLLNSALNCIVYSFFDRRFRKECLIFLKFSKRT